MIILIIALVSVTGMALITYPGTARKYLKQFNVSNNLDMIILNKLAAGFENSLVEVDINKNTLSSVMELNKAYEINSNSIHHGMIYSGTLKPDFDEKMTLRKMLAILAGNYARIRRDQIQETPSENLHTIEESGHVFDESNNYSYINKIIVSGNKVWLFMLVWDDNMSKSKVDNLLQTLWFKESKGVSNG